MWPKTFQERLESWINLRSRCKNSDLEHALMSINEWWFQTPWRPYYLHWDDHKTWPNSWELLADNVYCDLARAAGIMYTIAILEDSRLDDAILADTNLGNLVLVRQGKYILNWKPGQLLNIASKEITVHRTLDLGSLQHLTG